MSKVLIIEYEDGRIGLYKPTPIEWVTKGQTEDEFLNALEIKYQNDGINTHGSIDEEDVPIAPLGGNANYLIWDSSKLSYNISAITDAKRVKLRDQIQKIFAEKEKTVSINVGGNLFDCGNRMKQNLGLLAGAVSIGGEIPSSAKIRQANGNRVKLTTELHLELSNALASAHSDLLNVLEDHLDVIATADDAILETYDINTNWL